MVATGKKQILIILREAFADRNCPDSTPKDQQNARRITREQIEQLRQIDKGKKERVSKAFAQSPDHMIDLLSERADNPPKEEDYTPSLKTTRKMLNAQP